MHIDTATIRRLRDALLANGRIATAAVDNVDEGRRKASLQRVQPFVETMYLMMVIDGEPDRAEYEVMRGALGMLTDGLLHGAALDEMLGDCEALAREQGVMARLQAVGGRICADRVDRETAFSLATAVAIADGKLLAEESSLVESIAEWYGISAKRCAQLLQHPGDDAPE